MGQRTSIERAADRINPIDYREYYISDYVDTRIPLWLLRLGFPISKLKFDLIVNPDVQFTRWAHPDSEFGVPLPEGAGYKHPPDYSIKDIEYGMAVSLPFFINSEFNLTFYRGWHHGIIISNGEHSIISHPRVHSIGIDTSFVYEKFIPYIEYVNTFFSHEFPEGLELEENVPLYENTALIGLDIYPTPTLNCTIEGLVSRLKWPQEIGTNKTNILAFYIKKTLYRDRLGLEMRSILDIKGKGGTLLPRITYNLTDNIDLILGYAHFMGKKSEIFGLYTNKNCVELRIRLSL